MLIVVLKYASISSKHISNTYVSEQAELYLNSVIEQTLLAISAYDRSDGSCLSVFNDTKTKRAALYSAHVDIARYYLYEGSCSNVDTTPIGAQETQGMVMLHVEVNATLDGEQKVRILRRTLQRP